MKYSSFAGKPSRFLYVISLSRSGLRRRCAGAGRSNFRNHHRHKPYDRKEQALPRSYWHDGHGGQWRITPFSSSPCEHMGAHVSILPTSRQESRGDTCLHGKLSWSALRANSRNNEKWRGFRTIFSGVSTLSDDVLATTDKRLVRCTPRTSGKMNRVLIGAGMLGGWADDG